MSSKPKTTKTRVFMIEGFIEFSRQERIDDSLLLDAFRLIKGGSCRKHGEDIFSQSVARPGRGKSRGYRVFVAFSGDMAFFIDGYSRNKRDTMPKRDMDRCRRVGGIMLNMDIEGLHTYLKDGTIIEIGSI